MKYPGLRDSDLHLIDFRAGFLKCWMLMLFLSFQTGVKHEYNQPLHQPTQFQFIDMEKHYGFLVQELDFETTNVSYS